MDRTLAGVRFNGFWHFLTLLYIFQFQTEILKLKLVLLFYKHAYATTKYLR